MESRRASMVDMGEGSQFSNVDAVVTDICAYQSYQFTKQDGTPGKKAKGAGVAISYLTDANKVIQDFFELGPDFLPAASAEDADAGISSAQGDFITRIEGSTRKISPTFGWGIYVAALRKAGYPLEKLDNEGLSAYLGEKVHLVNQQAGARVPPGPKGEAFWFKRVPSVWLSGNSGEHKQETHKAPGGNGVGDAKETGFGVKQQSNGVAKRLVPVLLSALEEAGAPVGKNKLSQLAQKHFGDDWNDADKDAAQLLILKSDYLKTLPGTTFDGVKVSLAGE